MSSLESLENIKQKKESLGYSGNTDTIFLAVLNDSGTVKKTLLMNAGLAAMTAKYLIGSIESEGILLLNSSLTFKLKEGFSFIPFSSMRALSISKPSKGWAMMGRGNLNFLTTSITKDDGSTISLSVYKRMGLSQADSWVHNNLDRVQALIEGGKLPIGVDEQHVAPSIPIPTPTHATDPAFCSNCGSELTLGQKFCSKCGAKIVRE